MEEEERIDTDSLYFTIKNIGGTNFARYRMRLYNE